MKISPANLKILLLTVLGLLTLVSTSKAQDSIRQSYRKEVFFEIESTKEKIANLIATKSIAFSRQLSPNRFIVQSHSDFGHGSAKKITGSAWKFSQKNWSPVDHSQFILGYSDFELLKRDLQQKGIKFQLLKIREKERTVIIKLDSKRDQGAVFDSPFVTFIDRADKIAQVETLINYHDLSVNKINPVHHNTNYDGDGFSISIREDSFNPEDIDLAGRYVESSLASDELSVHANFMATMAAGGGNISPNSRGGAWKAIVSSSAFGDLFVDDPLILSQYNITAQNHSYGKIGALESFYGAEAVSYDNFVFENPTILHVFSAGNSGLLTNEQGPYAGLTSYSTLTANFKAAKNVLVVGGHNRDYSVNQNNSRGPTYDGRIKPELSAYGEAGTSDAAALVTGVGVLIQDAYTSSAGVNPPVSLIKASLIASADDIGATGIDHVTGYGSVNAAKAIDLIESTQFVVDEVANGQEEVLVMEIPANTKKATVALVWTDTVAQLMDAFALVNDLDLFITDPLNAVTLPWVLSSYPLVDSLTAAPKRKRDHLNTIELVTLDDPAEGTYQIHVSSFQIVNGSQPFSVAWTFEEADTFNWTFPLIDDAVETDTEIYLRWDNTITGTGTLEMSIDGGAWELIETDVPLASEFYAWQTPMVNATVNVRMNTGLSIEETGPFTVSKQLPLQVIYDCEQEGMIAWDKLSGVTEYEISSLGEKYLEPVTTTTDSSFMIDKLGVPSNYFSITPIINGVPAYRSYAYDITKRGVYCYYKQFYGFPENEIVHVYLTLSTLYNVKQVILEKQTSSGFVPIDTLAALTTDLEFTDTETSPAIHYYYRATIELLDGNTSTTEVVDIIYANETTFEVWPNPVKVGDPLTIFTDGSNLSIQFYTSDGRLVEKAVIEGHFFTSTIASTLLPGMFFYQIFRGNTRVATGKLMVVN